MSSSSPHPETSGKLIVQLPHWAAAVRVLDNLYRPVQLGLPIQQPETMGMPTLVVNLAPGAYQIEMTLGGSTDTQWVAVRPGKTAKLSSSDWQNLQIPSAIPAADSTPLASKQREAAERWSRQPTWAAAPGGGSRLYIFTKTQNPKEHASFAKGLALLDAREKVITDLTVGARDKRAGGVDGLQRRSLPPVVTYCGASARAFAPAISRCFYVQNGRRRFF